MDSAGPGSKRSYSLSDQTPDSDETVALSEMLSILSQRHNRHILLHLLRNETPVTVDELAAHIAAVEDNASVGESTQPAETLNRGQSEL